MRKILFVLALALPSAAQAAAVPATDPKPAGAPHSCAQYYPEDLAEAHVEGTTTLSYRVLVTGKPWNITVAKSSGNAGLDAAAVQCVATWLYEPATRDGKPFDTPWQSNVQWKVEGVALAAPKPADAHVCDNYPHAAVWNGSEGKAIVSFRVATDGTVKSPRIVRSTGDAELDAAGLACVAGWHYVPATNEGTPVEVEWRAQVAWRMHDTGEPDAPCSRYATVTADVLKDISGRTKVTFRVMPDGSVQEPSISRSSGSDALDQAALRCVGNMHMNVRKAKLPPAGIFENFTIDWHVDLPKG
ncbi:MAG TPA: TonB family protein [Rhizomicrobium sp.]|nr:TonB family protein [Rhizomicrobium sp.]